MPISNQFALREAFSDVVGMKFLGVSGAQQVEMEYDLAAGSVLAAVDSFISPKSLPNALKWDAGNYVLSLLVASAPSIEFTAELWRADASGNLLQQIGSRPATQTAAAAVSGDPVL